MKTNKRMAALLAMVGAVTLLAGCGKSNNENPTGQQPGVVAGTWNGVGVYPGLQNGQVGQAGPGCATLVPNQPATLGFTNQVNSAMVGSGAATQTAQMVAPNVGVVATMQVQITGQQQQQYPYNYGYAAATMTGVVQITPAGATALLQEASLSYGGYYGGSVQSAQICIANMQSLTLNPLRGGIYLSGLPMPRSGMPHLYF